MLVALVYIGALIAFVGGCVFANALLFTNPRDDSLVLVGSGTIILGFFIALGSNVLLHFARVKEPGDSSG